jgi:hypothetical protein
LSKSALLIQIQFGSININIEIGFPKSRAFDLGKCKLYAYIIFNTAIICRKLVIDEVW